MEHKDHADKSLKLIAEKSPEFYLQHKEVIDKLIPDLHAWMDQYFNSRGDDYDYTGINVMKHWEKLHHIQGINMAADHFSERYGKLFRQIVTEEAQRHVMDDLEQVPDESFYHQIGIWKRLRGF
jgi:hypothetical protein